MAALRNIYCIFNGFRDIRKQRIHLFSCLETILRIQFTAIRCRHIRTVCHAEERVMRLIHIRPNKIRLVGRYDGKVVLVGHIKHRFLDLCLIGLTVARQFHIQAVHEKVFQQGQASCRFFFFVLQQ